MLIKKVRRLNRDRAILNRGGDKRDEICFIWKRTRVIDKIICLLVD